jgi:predicted nucleotide-binding protein
MDALDSGPVGKLFIGHGRSPAWKNLRDFLKDRLHLEWVEYDRDAVAGYATKERLEQMLAEAWFAFLVMTGEDERPDGTIHARDNVIHEVGLFQGKLGFTRAIILLEDGCAEFSNIIGLTQIRFPKGDIMARSEEIRRVLERELNRRADNLVTEIRFDYLPDKLTKHG